MVAEPRIFGPAARTTLGYPYFTNLGGFYVNASQQAVATNSDSVALIAGTLLSTVDVTATLMGTGSGGGLVADWNPSGYLWNVVHQVRVQAGVESPAPARQESAIPPFPAKVKQACIGCHESDIIAGQRITRAQWDREIGKMTGWGATVQPADRNEILEFLAQHFGPR